MLRTRLETTASQQTKSPHDGRKLLGSRLCGPNRRRPKSEIHITEKGSKEVEERVHELQTKWNQMAAVYKTGDKDKMKDMMDNNRSFLPMATHQT